MSSPSGSKAKFELQLKMENRSICGAFIRHEMIFSPSHLTNLHNLQTVYRLIANYSARIKTRYRQFRTRRWKLQKMSYSISKFHDLWSIQASVNTRCDYGVSGMRWHRIASVDETIEIKSLVSRGPQMIFSWQ